MFWKHIVKAIADNDGDKLISLYTSNYTMKDNEGNFNITSVNILKSILKQCCKQEKYNCTKEIYNYCIYQRDNVLLYSISYIILYYSSLEIYSKHISNNLFINGGNSYSFFEASLDMIVNNDLCVSHNEQLNYVLDYYSKISLNYKHFNFEMYITYYGRDDVFNRWLSSSDLISNVSIYGILHIRNLPCLFKKEIPENVIQFLGINRLCERFKEIIIKCKYSSLIDYMKFKTIMLKYIPETHELIRLCDSINIDFEDEYKKEHTVLLEALTYVLQDTNLCNWIINTFIS